MASKKELEERISELENTLRVAMGNGSTRYSELTKRIQKLENDTQWAKDECKFLLSDFNSLRKSVTRDFIGLTTYLKIRRTFRSKPVTPPAVFEKIPPKRKR